ncbi:MAG: ATP-binding cassette domain-containing protein, partial [Verrucomicrobiota bacterium]|nr:ATP-binding cassette domain-containing protein [Verrucomicrobiota bacterium]
MGDEKVVALDKVSLEVPEGDYVAIMGPSGSGKSTLLNILGCLDKPTSGNYQIGGESVEEMNDEDLSALRAKSIGFIFQSYNLIPYLNVLENISLPASYEKESNLDDKKARELATIVGLGDRTTHL